MNTNRQQFSRVLWLVAVLALSVAACAPAPASVPSPAGGGSGKVTVMVGDFGNERFDPVFATGTGVRNYMSLVHGWLVTSDSQGRRVPGIAKSWRLSPDGLTWTFVIREGVKWHDGTTLTAEDVLWSFRYAFGPQALTYSTNDKALRVTRALDSIQLSGPNEVSITTKSFISIIDLVDENSPGGSPVVIMPKRAELKEDPAYEKNPIGAGPMKLVARVPGSSMTLERFDDYYYQPKGGLPEDRRVKFQTLQLVLAPQEATRVAALRTGEVDIAQVSLDAKKDLEGAGGRLVFGPEASFLDSQFIGCWIPRTPAAPCQDKRVRQAFAYAMNPKAIAQLYGPGVFENKGWGGVTPSSMGYSPSLEPYPFDPQKARQLLADAGYPGGKGFGKLIVNTYPSSTMAFVVEGAQLAADSWKRELGIDVEVRVVDKVALRASEEASKVMGEIIWRDNETRPDGTSNLQTYFGDPKSPRRLHNDQELFTATQQAFAIIDPDKRAAASTELFKRLWGEAYLLPVGYTNVPWGIGPRVLAWQPYPLRNYVSAPHTISVK